MGAPLGIGFSEDGTEMLIMTVGTEGGAIARIGPDGRVLGAELRGKGIGLPTAMARAPESFGRYAGDLFITDGGTPEAMQFDQTVPMTQPLEADGRVLRVTKTGEVEVVLTGLFSPAAMIFVDDKLWVSDINGDFIAGKRELPAGVDCLSLAPPFPGVAAGVRGPAPERAVVVHRLLEARTTPAFNLVSQDSTTWVFPRSAIETPAPHFSHALGAAELWGRWCFGDEEPFRAATAKDLEAALRLGCYGSTRL